MWLGIVRVALMKWASIEIIELSGFDSSILANSQERPTIKANLFYK